MLRKYSILWLRCQRERLCRLSPQTIVEKDVVSPLCSCCTSVDLFIIRFCVLITQPADFCWLVFVSITSGRDYINYVTKAFSSCAWDLRADGQRLFCLTRVTGCRRYKHEERSVETCLLRISHLVPPAGSLFDAFIFLCTRLCWAVISRCCICIYSLYFKSLFSQPAR